MGEVHRAESGLLIAGLMVGEGVSLDEVHARLGEVWGPIVSATDIRPFTQTSYYEDEMGTGLRRQFLAFERRLDPSQLIAVKIQGNDLEREWTIGGKRRVNIDPGCLTLAKLVLASTKDHAHRVHLGQGIHAEVTLVFHRGKGYEPWPWTYPDYREAWVREWLAGVRAGL